MIKNPNGNALGHDKEIEIIVNGKPKVFTEKYATFVDIVELAFNTTDVNGIAAYTLSYYKGNDNKPEGFIVKGESVKLKKGMVFNVTATNKS